MAISLPRTKIHLKLDNPNRHVSGARTKVTAHLKIEPYFSVLQVSTPLLSLSATSQELSFQPCPYTRQKKRVEDSGGKEAQFMDLHIVGSLFPEQINLQFKRHVALVLAPKTVIAHLRSTQRASCRNVFDPFCLIRLGQVHDYGLVADKTRRILAHLRGRQQSVVLSL